MELDEGVSKVACELQLNESRIFLQWDSKEHDNYPLETSFLLQWVIVKDKEFIFKTSKKFVALREGLLISFYIDLSWGCDSPVTRYATKEVGSIPFSGRSRSVQPII